MERLVPKKFIGLYDKSKSSRKAAIRSFCLECMGYSPSEVEMCTDTRCPLFKYRIKG